MNKHIPYLARDKPIIGLDLHGVILDDGRLKEQVAQVVFNKRIPAAEFTSKAVVHERGLLTGHQYQELQDLIYNNHFIGRRMPLVRGVKKYLPLLANLGTLIIVTSNYGSSLKLSRELLEHHRLINYFADIKDTPVGLDKSDIVKDLHLDFYLDDDPYKLENLIGLVPHLYLLDYKHNQSVDCSRYAARVKSIAHFYKLLKRKIHGDSIHNQGRQPCSPNNNFRPICV